MFKVGSGSLQYQLVEGWEQLPSGWSHPDVAGVATDSQGRVYLFCRTGMPVIVYDRDGHFLDAWGEGQFGSCAHGIYIDKDDFVFLVDYEDHTARKFTLDGKLLMTIGTSKVHSDSGHSDETRTVLRGAPPFNRPTNIVATPTGDLYASDGYANSRVHGFTAEGVLKYSWGEPGTAPGHFNTPHGVWIADDGRVFVADRENERIQIFSPEGQYLTEWTDVQRPCDIYMDGQGLVYVAELVKRKGFNSFRLGLTEEEQPSRVTIFDGEGNVLLRWGALDAATPGNFAAAHDIWVDNQGAIYVAEVTETIGISGGFVPAGTHSFQKFARI